ncbi:EpsG family protein [Pantoea sp. Acro-807]|uniref:EpsG family protein n=1 Tax=Pantoea sp. Acro-807 TaxID=2608356 RepID=UPI00141A6524|nr:EpsG family protein [Pantoea sp. Acro-807]NIE70573.1 EpsG family protein [Pantoea sp. Acro-807]
MFETYSTYILILFFSSLFAFCYQKSKSPLSFFFLILTFLCLWIPAAIRFGVGTDYFRYLGMVQSVRLGYIATEYGYYIINYIVMYLNISPQWVMAITSFLIVFFVFLAIKKEHFFIAIFIFVCLFYLPSMSLIRQAIGVSIIAWGVSEYLKSKKNTCFFAIIIASFFHISMLILLPVYFVSRLGLKARPQLLIPVILAMFFLSNEIINFLSFPFVAQSKYGFYLNSYFAEKPELGSGIGVLIKIFLPLCYLVRARHFQKIHKNHNILAWLSFTVIAANLISINIHIFSRVADVFLFVSFVAGPYVLLGFDRKVIKQLFVFFTIILLTAFYIRTVQVSINNDEGGIGISPYQTIFQ